VIDVREFVVGGEKRRGRESYAVRNPYDGSLVDEVARPGPGDLDDALSVARAGFDLVRALPAWKRADALARVSAGLERDRNAFARTITLESGKPITQARAEVDRAAHTFRISAEEARRIGGEVLPMDLAPGNEGRFALVRHFPVGPVACITPFNFPLNLVAHKVAPALAAGCSFVLKPASQTPGASLDLADLLLDAGFPGEAVSVLPMKSSDTAPLVEDPRTRALSFTGSPAVGWELRRAATRKKVVLELGGNAGLIVDRSADLDLAVAKTVAGGFGYSGQTCISVQRVFVHDSIHDTFCDRLASAAAALPVGDPLDEPTVVGPVISDEDGERIESWVREAVDGGATVLTGGGRDGRMVEPTVLSGTTPGMKVCDREVFAPVVVVEAFAEIRQAIAAVDNSEFGLQAGIFTRDLANAVAAFEGIEVGAVIVNDAPTYRVDHMPYGGVKDSGTGREGPRYAIEDYTEPRLLVVNPGEPE